MNSFEYGFFDELQKLATDSRAVYDLYKGLPDWQDASRGELGGAATRDAQQEQRGKDSTVPGRVTIAETPSLRDWLIEARAKRYEKVRQSRENRAS